MTSFFHAYDLRGIYPDEIDEETAEKVGKAYGTFIDADEVLVGRDGRTHGKEITDAFIRGILSTGTDVAYSGMVPSPLVYFGQVKNSFESAAVVTASHNPAEYTGFKFNLEGALAMSRDGGMRHIEELYESGSFDEAKGDRTEIELKKDYIEAVRNEVGEINLEVVINCGNGVTGVLARGLFEELGCSVKMINEEVDGDFPNHLADPGSEEARKVTEDVLSSEDLGIIFDGDGDRAGFILPDYGFIDEDEVIALLAEESLGREKGKVVHDLRVSKLVPEKIEEFGGEPVESQVGHTFISEMIRADEDIVFAGELSGHFYFPAFGFPWDDGLFAAALMSKIASEENLVEKLEEFPDYPVSPEINIDCPNDVKDDVMEEVAEEYSDYETSTMDGVKVYFDSGWGLVRPSSTEPKVRVRCEADSEENLDEIVKGVDSKVKKIVSRYS